MSKHLNLGERGHTDEPLFACPYCHRHGFSGPGLGSHRCEALPRQPNGQRGRLDLETILAIRDGLHIPPLTPVP